MRKLREIIVTYLTSLEYHGCFGAEFKCDTRDNRFKLLDVNARSTWYTSHNTVCGQNIILASYREAVGEAIESQLAYESGVYAITIVKDLQSMTAMFRNGTLSWRDLLTSYTKKRHFLIYDQDDPRPFLQRPLIELKKKRAHV
jgi:predicted ATP-grasp superfamily ATP-dependent carboligase